MAGRGGPQDNEHFVTVKAMWGYTNVAEAVRKGYDAAHYGTGNTVFYGYFRSDLTIRHMQLRESDATIPTPAHLFL
jgi:hypothetical protein